MDECEEVDSPAVETGCEAAEMFEAVEATFDAIALSIAVLS